MLWRLALAGLLLLNAFLVFQLVWGSNGLLRYFELKAMRGRLQTQVEQVRQENVRLSREIRLLKNSPEYIGKVIRSEMHYVQPGEIVYLREERK